MSKVESIQKRKLELENKESSAKEKLDSLREEKKRLNYQLKVEIEKERNHRHIVWGSHLLYLLRTYMKFTPEEISILSDDAIKEALNEFFKTEGMQRAIGSILRRHIKECQNPVTNESEAGDVGSHAEAG